MADVLSTVHRIRKAEERRAHARFAAAEEARAAGAAELQSTQDSLSASWQRAQDRGEIVDLWSHHTDALRMELRRRNQERELDVRARAAGEARLALKNAVVETRLVEVVAANRAEIADLENARRARGALDEQGLMGWWRRSA